MQTRPLVFIAAMLIALAGCAPGVATGGSNQSVITQEELESTNASSLHEAVQRLRPRWLNIRSSTTMGGAGQTVILVYQNQARLGGIEVLRDMHPREAMWIQYLDGPTASATLPGIGSQDVEAAIVIHTTPRR